MKKFLVSILIMFCLICRVSALETKTDTLTKVEASVLGIEYPDEKLEKRLSRLEEYLYGNVQKGSSKIRLAKVLETTKYNLLKEDKTTIAESDNSIDEVAPLDNTVDYPILDEVEKRLGLKQQKTGSLHNRLATIEKKMFNSSYDKEDFFTRVERIKSKIYDDRTLARNDNYDDFDNPETSFDNIMMDREPTDSYFNRGATKVRYKLSLLEQRLLKNTFSDETNNDRLARLENVVFDTQFYNDNESERLDRLESALKAKKSSPKYDNNKFQQGLSTAMQIGAMVLMVLAFIL